MGTILGFDHRRLSAGLAMAVLWGVAVPALQAREISHLKARVERVEDHGDWTLEGLDMVQAQTHSLARAVDAAAGPDLAAVVEAVRPSVVTVEAGQWMGSGFAVDVETKDGPRTGIITNAHVVEDAIVFGEPVIVRRGFTPFRATLHRWHLDLDLALILVDVAVPALPWASRNGHPARVGDFVFAVGSPIEIEGTTTMGIVSNVWINEIQTDVAISDGSSGGPLLNRFGEVIGINTYSLIEGEALNFAIPVEQTCGVLFECS